MDELPREARELLRLASDAYDPPSAEARMRVRRGVAMAVTAGVGASIASQAIAQGSVKAGLFSTVAGKLVGAGMAVAVVGTLAVSAPHFSRLDSKSVRPSHAQPARPRPRAEPTTLAPVVVPAAKVPEISNRPVAAPLPPQVVMPTEKRSASEKRVQRQRFHPKRQRRFAASVPAPTLPEGLSAEMSLLKVASQAIAEGDTTGAERALAQHASQFRSSPLREEREGLTALVHCKQNPSRSRSEGERFLSHAPKSVLAQRVARACGIDEEP